MPFTPNDLTKKFIHQAKSLLNTGKVKRYSEIATAVNWDKTALSNVINERRNIPQEIYNEFTKVYNIEETKNPAPSQEQDLVNDLLASLKDQVATQKHVIATLEERVKSINQAFAELRDMKQHLDRYERMLLMIQSQQQAFQEHWVQQLPKTRKSPEQQIVEINKKAYEIFEENLSSGNR